MSSFECEVCKKKYKQHRNLRRHVKVTHGKIDNGVLPSLKAEPVQWFCCSNCSKKYRNSSNLRTHSAKEHGTVVRKRTRKPILCCPLRCGYRSNERPNLISHMKTNHDIDVETVNINFPDYETFVSWKEETEYETTSKFVVSAPKYSSKQKTRYYFSCHRSGNFVTESKGRVHLKKQGSKKINGFCPASMKVTDNRSVGRCEVVFVKTHVGHDNDLGHLYLTSRERESIAMKIAANVSFDNILEELRGDVHSARDRLQLVTRKDLHNIKSSFKIDEKSPHFMSLEKGRVTSAVKDLQARHERSLQMSTDVVVEEGDGWLVPVSEDSEEFHKVERNLCKCEGCQLTCLDCKTCIHAYTCTCVDYKIRTNMCKHIHLVCRCISSKDSGIYEACVGNNNSCDFQDLVSANCVEVKVGDTEELAATPINPDCERTTLPLSLDTRKKQAFECFENIVSSVTSFEEMNAIEEIVGKIKLAISTVHSSANIFQPVGLLSLDSDNDLES